MCKILRRLFFFFTSNIVQSMSEKLSKMDQMVRRMVVESLGLEKYLNQHLDSTNYVIRVQKYDAPPTNETDKVGLVTHTDKNIVTILYQNEVNGLQVMTKDGDWITTQPSPNSFIVMVGQSFHVSGLMIPHILIYICVVHLYIYRT